MCSVTLSLCRPAVDLVFPIPCLMSMSHVQRNTISLLSCCWSSLPYSLSYEYVSCNVSLSLCRPTVDLVFPIPCLMCVFVSVRNCINLFDHNVTHRLVFFYFQGFYCDCEKDFDDLCNSLRTFGQRNKNMMFEVCKERPPHLQYNFDTVMPSFRKKGNKPDMPFHMSLTQHSIL